MIGLVTMVVAVAVVAGWFSRSFTMPDPDTWVHGTLLSEAYDPPDQVVEIYMDQGDGQLFAAHAMDPFLRNPEGVRGGPEEQAYRLQRPLYGWLGWVASAGRPEAVAWALVAVTVASTVFLVVASGWAAARRGAAVGFGLLMLTAPGVVADLLRCGPEALGTALLAVGLGLWLRPRRRVWPAIACFAVATLARETLAVVPLVLAASEMWDRRRVETENSAARPSTPAWLPVLAVLPYVVWVLVLRVVIGAWPRGSVDGRLSLVPGAGMVDAVGNWRTEEWIAVGMILAMAVAGLVLGRDRRLRLLLIAHLAMASVLGLPVWNRYVDFGRVLLPLTLISALALASGRPGQRWPSTARRAARGPHATSTTAGAASTA